MRKTLLFLLVALLTPVFAMAQSNNAISKAHRGSSYYGTKSEYRLLVPFDAVGHPQSGVDGTPGYDFSVGMWVKTTAVYTTNNPKVGILFRSGTGNHMNTNGAIQLYTDASGALTLGFGNDNLSGGGQELAAGTASFDEWHYILMVFDSTSDMDNPDGGVRVYVDGVETLNNTEVNNFGYNWGDGVFQFICQSYSGQLDELHMFNAALTEAEAATAYTNARAVSSLATLYTFDAVTEGTTGQFASQAGSIEGQVATFQSCSYDNYWEEGLVDLSSQTETAPTLVASDREVAAVEVEVFVDECEGGVLSLSDGENTYAESATAYNLNTGTELTVTATPDEGYSLVGIQLVPVANPENAVFIPNGESFVVTESAHIVAEFTNSFYELTLVKPDAIGATIYSVTGDEISDLTQMVASEYALELTVPDTHVITSVKLGEADVEYDEAEGLYFFEITENATLTIEAREKASYTVTINQPTGGTINVRNNGADLSSGASVLEGTVVTLSNTPATGFAFVKYTVDGADYNAETYTVNANVTISGEFEERTEIDYCTPTCLGSQGSTTNYSGRGITSISVSDGVSSMSLSGNGTSGTRAIYYDQTSNVLETEAGKTINVTVSGQGEWMNTYVYVDWDLNGFTDSDEVFNNYANGHNYYAASHSFVVPEGTPGGEYRVRYEIDWDDNGPCEVGQADKNNCDFVTDYIIKVKSSTLDAPRSVSIAVAEGQDALGTVAFTNPASTEASISTDLAAVVMTATPATTAAFLNWTDEAGDVVSTNATYTYNGTTDASFTANFGYSVNITVGSNGSAYMTADGANLASGSVVAPNTEITVNATAAASYQVGSVTVNSTPIEKVDGAYKFNITANSDVNVTFVERQCVINFNVTGAGTCSFSNSTNTTYTEAAGDIYTNGGSYPGNGSSEVFLIMKPEEGNRIKSVSYTDDNGERSLNIIYYTEETAEAARNNADETFRIPFAQVGEPNCLDDPDYLSEIYFAQDEYGTYLEGAYWTILNPLGDVTFNVSFEDNPSGIENIFADEENGPVEYYNLQGVKVSSENLANGFYIVRKGNKVAKVYINK